LGLVWRRLGANPSDVTRILNRLVRSTVVERRGHAFAASSWAIDALNFLEDALSQPHIEANVTAAARASALEVVIGGSSFDSQTFGAATLNGAWVGSVVDLGASISGIKTPLTAAGTGVDAPADMKILNPERSDAGDAARSHLYK
jgi:hypothetical protein